MYRYSTYTPNDFLDGTCICNTRPEMKGWWRFDERTSRVAFDSAGAVDNASRALSQPVPCEGRVKNAGRFTANFTMKVANTTDFNFGKGDFTIVAWIKAPPDANGKRTILFKGTNGPGYALYLSDGRLTFWMNGSIRTMPAQTPSLADDRWHLIGVSVDRTGTSGKPAGKLIVLRDGVQQPIVHTFTPHPGSVDNDEQLLMAGGAVVGPFVLRVSGLL